MKNMKKMEEKWRAEDDARIMAEYQQILQDKNRMEKAIKVAQEQAKDLNKRAKAMSKIAKKKISSKKKK